MKSLRCLAVSLTLSLPYTALHTAKAQSSIYGTVTVSNYGYAFRGESTTYDSDRFGLGAGGFYNFPIRSRFTAGIDLRGSFTPNADGGSKGFVSARFGFVPHHNPLKPYFQIGGGFIHAKVPAFTETVQAQAVTAAALDLALGLDIRLTPSFDLRLPELESGAGGNGSMTAGSASLSGGIVYHFHPVRQRNP